VGGVNSAASALDPAAHPPTWAVATLGEFLANRAIGVVPAKTPNVTFELYSVPSHGSGAPEVVAGKDIGSNKQVVSPGTVLLCKINPRINRSWVVILSCIRMYT